MSLGTPRPSVKDQVNLVNNEERQPRVARDTAWCLAILVMPVLSGLIGYAACALQGPLHSRLTLAVGGALLLAAGAGAGLFERRTLHQLRRATQEGAAVAPGGSRSEAQRQLRHDIRGALSPALLTADRLLTNKDPAVKRAGEIMVGAVEKAASLMADPAEPPVSPPGHP